MFWLKGYLGDTSLTGVLDTGATLTIVAKRLVSMEKFLRDYQERGWDMLRTWSLCYLTQFFLYASNCVCIYVRSTRRGSPLPILDQKSLPIVPKDAKRRSVPPGLAIEIATLLDRELEDAVPGRPETLDPGIAEVKTATQFSMW